MVLRGLIRDFLCIYLGYEIIKGSIFGNFSISTTILITSIILFILSIWFLLERIGIIPKFGE